MAIMGYCRVSTKGQSNDGNGLNVQVNEIVERYENAAIYTEQFTGASIDRPVLNQLIGDLSPNDTLVVTKLDRLARNTVEGIEIVQKLFDMGVSVHVLNLGLLENTAMGKFFLTTLLAVAEMERSTIIERTQSGKALAKLRPGFTEGRPNKFTPTQIEVALHMLNDKSYKQVSRELNISTATLVRAVRKRREAHNARE